MVKDYGFKPTPVDENKSIMDYTKKEAKLMFEWYLDDLPKRTKYLFDYINRFEDIPMEFNFETFKKVVNWMGKVLKIEYKTPEEIEKEKRMTPEFAWESITKWEFTEDSILIIMAVGGYLGMVMIEELPNSRWELDTHKKSVDYNKAVIIKQTGGQLSPTRITDVIAFKLIKYKYCDIDGMIEAWNIGYKK